ncbi:hypothetical protein BH10ACI1_BH10ACI1_33070 [soil metagenome]
MDKLVFTDDELVNQPESRALATGKIITAFNVKITEKTVNLNTGVKFEYKDELFEIMNREPVQSKPDFYKFNCAHLSVPKTED